MEKSDWKSIRDYAKERYSQSSDEWDYIECLCQEFKPTTCPECGHPTEFRFMSYNLSWEVAFCKECRWVEVQAEIQKDIHKIMWKCGGSRRFFSADLTDFKKEYQEAVRTDDKSQGLYIVGQRGVGKTHLATAILKDHILNHPKGYGIDYKLLPDMISVTDLIMRIKATFAKDSEESEEGVLDHYSNCKTLILDDLGTEKPTEWAVSTLYLIVDRRYRDMRKTIITSNLSLKEIAERLDDRIASRLAEMCKVIQITGKDRRVSK